VRDAEQISVETAILDLLCDEDGELNVGEALTPLLYVVCGLCNLDEAPDEIAAEFGAVLLRTVRENGLTARRLQS
jgi:hypothetical protein